MPQAVEAVVALLTSPFFASPLFPELPLALLLALVRPSPASLTAAKMSLPISLLPSLATNAVFSLCSSCTCSLSSLFSSSSNSFSRLKSSLSFCVLASFDLSASFCCFARSFLVSFSRRSSSFRISLAYFSSCFFFSLACLSAALSISYWLLCDSFITAVLRLARSASSFSRS